MNADDEIKWVTLELEFPDEIGAQLEKLAQEEGLSLKCYCTRVLLRHLLKDASAEEKEQWLSQIPATLRKNGCGETVQL